MNIPTIPTDNLYKFMALTGVFLVLVSAGAIFYALDNLQVNVIKQQGNLKKLEKSLKVGANLVEASNQLTDLETESEIMRYKVKLIWAGIVYSFIGQIVGAVLAWKGFTWWYRRLQIYQDKQVRTLAQKGSSP